MIMKRIITVYIILLTSSLLWPLHAQRDAMSADTAVVAPLYGGLSVGADVFGVIGRFLLYDFTSAEVSLNADFRNKFFPVVEVGFGTIDMTDETYSIHYKSAAPYARIGLDYNLMAKKQTENYLFAGLRYGFSAFKYDVAAPDMSDEVWGGTIPFSYSGVRSSAHWMEMLLGIKVKIVRNFFMGWTARFKFRFSAKETLNTTPWYIPGYGDNKSSNFGFTYNLIYQLPF